MHQRVAIVTGASRGIGRGIALALGQSQANAHSGSEGPAHPWRIVVNYAHNRPAAEDVARQITAAGATALCIQADIGLHADRERLIDETLAHFGAIDLLVNNAGIAPQTRADMLQASEESFDHVIAVNLKGPYFLTQRVANEMIRHRENTKKAPADHPPPAIITISSISAYTASTNRGDYCLAKAGLGMMTALYAARLASHGINVYEIRPGIIATDMTGPVKAKYDALIADGLTPIPRWGRPDDVAKAVLAVASGLLPFSTGEVLNVDGGFHMHRL